MNFNLPEILATTMGLIQGALVWADKRTNWIFYCLQYIFMVIFSITAQLYGDVTNSLIYIVIGIFGWFMWNKKTEKPIRHCSAKERVIYSAVILLLSVIIYFILSKTGDPLPLLDAVTTAGGYVATYYMLTRRVDTWILWLIIDVLYVIEYYLLPDTAWSLMALNLIWTAMAVGSFITWNRLAKTKNNETPKEANE